ncbi:MULTISPECIES: helix-turn-helix domain-containing protein [Actinoalloteichus]|uniref:DNA binding protein with helix-turn-helix domain n=1 Tax=Actinoalloteichus fjordicus TaxID=1612552 RepID=A0AAC9PS87_9PSEU|nr:MULTISPECIES: helix-turn-helix transcriptional regulator [Actinoalloteichus]APU14737.1 DNA binding protein with helix-turn-helix domain [Actinoalloteichus fjordicus]APU20705.1 DNA binding protein with helix-turn-helix domain [Actinoalloteichus sp. GBA129-24]
MFDGHLAGNTTVRRWQLTEALRQLREQAGLTHDQVVAELRKGEGKWSRPKLSRIENREQGVRVREVDQLLDVYQVRDRELRESLLELAGTPKRHGWTVDIQRNLPEDFHRFLMLETALLEHRQFETLLVPGLLQTADYARALISGIDPGLSEDEVERRVVARITRQQILSRTKPPRLHAILDAGLLERPVGGRRVMQRQLRQIAEACEAPNITIQVLPKSVGASPALEGPFSILTLPDPIPDVGYADAPGRAVYFEDRDHVRTYTLRFGALSEQALTQSESVSLINTVATNVERDE